MTGNRRLRTAILISGRGSNMAALISAAMDPGFPAEIALVLSNRVGAHGLALAEEAGIPAKVIASASYEDRAGHEAAIQEALTEARIEIVCLAGYMRLLSPGFVGLWRGRMINIHPSLLPSFKGLDTHSRVLAAGCRIHGATVHFVTAEMDDGPIIAQSAVPVLAEDSEQGLAERVLRVEHRIYPMALKLVAEGSVRLSGNGIVSAPAGVTDQGQVLISAG